LFVDSCIISHRMATVTFVKYLVRLVFLYTEEIMQPVIITLIFQELLFEIQNVLF
jgi:hypothetical protein